MFEGSHKHIDISEAQFLSGVKEMESVVRKMLQTYGRRIKEASENVDVWLFHKGLEE